MTDQDIADRALAQAHKEWDRADFWDHRDLAAAIEEFAVGLVHEEREACAKIAEKSAPGIHSRSYEAGWENAAACIAKAIRKRGQP